MTQYVPLHSLPDLRPGDLLLLDEQPSVSPLIVLDHPDGGLGGWWISTPADREMLVDGDKPWRLAPGTTHGDAKVRELARLRGVTLADLTADRWPEVDARLRAARSTAPTISVTMGGENPPRADFKVGDTVPLDRMPELPVGAVLVQSVHEHYVHVRTPTGWHAEALSLAYGPDDTTFLVTGGPDDTTFLVTGSKREPHEAARLVGLGCTATTRLEWTRQLAACGHEPAREWLRRHDTPPQSTALAVGDMVPVGRGADVPEWTCVQGADCHVWRRVGDRWQTVGYGSSQPREMLLDHSAQHERVEGHRVVALGCDAADRVGLARQLADQGWRPATEWLGKHGLLSVVTEPPAPPPHKVGDEVTAEQAAALPVGAVVSGYREGVVRVHADAAPRGPAGSPSPPLSQGWRNVCIDDHVMSPLADPVDPTARTRPEAGKLLGLGVPFGPTRADVARSLAAQGYAPAAEGLRKLDSAPRLLRDIAPGTLAQITNGTWVYRLPNGNGWYVSEPASRAEIVNGRVDCWPWTAPPTPLRREIPNVKPADLAPGAWERLIGEAPRWTVGQQVTAEEAAQLPVGAVVTDSPRLGFVGAVVTDSPRLGFDVRLDSGWFACGWGSKLDEAIRVSSTAYPGKILALLGPTDLTSRRSIVEALAHAGHQPAIDRLAAEQPAKPAVKVGDEVTAEQAASLPPGVVLSDSPGFVLRKLDDGTWHETGLDSAWVRVSGPAPTSHGRPAPDDRRRIIGLNVPRGVTRREIAESLAAQGYQPAIDALAALSPAKPVPTAADTFEASTAPYFEPLPELGAVLTADQIRALPVGAVVAEDARWGYQRLEGDHWRVVLIGQYSAGDLAFPLDPGQPRTATWVGNIRGTLAALDAPRGRELAPFLRHLADQGWQPARESLERHAAALAPPAAPSPVVASWTPVVGEVVPGEHVAALPEGAVIQWNTGDVWRRGKTGFAVVCDNGTRLGGEVDLSGTPAKLLGLGSTDAASAWVMRDHAHKPAAEPALPAPGEVVDATALDRLPIGAVVDSRDGSGSPWAIKRSSKRWDWIGGHALRKLDDGTWHETGLDSAWVRSAVMVGFDAPGEPGALRAWCLERGYGRATTVESYVTEQNVRKQALDAAPAAEHDEDMATQPMHITTTAGVFIQDVGEDAQQFAARVNRETRALAAQQPKDVSPVTTQPGALAAFGGLLKSFGNKAAVKALETAVEGRTLVLVDGGRLAVHGAIVKGVEEIWGEGAGSTVKAIAESKVTVVAEDLLGAFGAFVAGKHNLADVLLSRSARRIGDGVGAALVSKGARIVEQVVEAGSRALTAAATAAELPETASTEGEVAAE